MTIMDYRGYTIRREGVCSYYNVYTEHGTYVTKQPSEKHAKSAIDQMIHAMTAQHRRFIEQWKA